MNLPWTYQHTPSTSVAQSVINDLPSKVQTLLSMKGQFLTITYGKECKVRKGEVPIFKFSKMMLRAGVSYDEIQAVKAKRESGELPYIIEHKGNLNFRFFTVPNAQRYAPTFVRNGKEITREEAQTACLASEFQERETTLETMTVKVEGILEINGKEVV